LLHETIPANPNSCGVLQYPDQGGSHDGFLHVREANDRDAFQATFLVLVRKAASLASRELLANWLYGVAHQTALNARAAAARRTARERQVTQMPEPEMVQQDLWHDLQPLLDQELSRLPNKYRSPIVLP
jgi:DNA-directed RNA polymerase specialized sigma24 family protein